MTAAAAAAAVDLAVGEKAAGYIDTAATVDSNTAIEVTEKAPAGSYLLDIPDDSLAFAHAIEAMSEADMVLGIQDDHQRY